MSPDNGPDPGAPRIGGDGPADLSEVLASIRALVSAETAARTGGPESEQTVLMLTPEMRVGGGGVHSGEVLSEGIHGAPPRIGGAPILDEEALRNVVNTIVRDELQGELGDRITRNLRKLIRREIGAMIEDRKDG